MCAMADGAGKPAWWLAGNFAPVERETEAFDLKVEGALPPELSGVFMRNGPNPAAAPTPHWFFGDGMLHGVRIENGRARWYRNRYIGTARRGRTFSRNDPAAMMDKTLSTANTALVRHAGRILALEEGHFPYEVDAELGTLGCRDFDGRLTTSFTAHPKVCPETGEMMAFGYSFMAPHLVYHRFDRAGRLVQSADIPVGGPTMIHDFCTTRTRTIFMDLPIVFDLALAMRGSMPYRWSDDYPARLGVMARDGRPEDIQWFDIAPCYVFHPLNAYDDGARVVLDVARYETMWKHGFSDAPGLLHRFTLDTATGRASETTIDAGRPLDFPRVPDSRVGLRHRYGYAMASGEGGDGVAFGTSVHKFDLETGAVASCEFGAGRRPGEAVFARVGDGEDSGYLMTIVHDENTGISEFCVIDADAPARGPIARVQLPQRVPYGFHGAWFADL
jgi:carotenoid cleavage dioxygenase-like enzyme